jgi:thioredoxin reductase
MQQRTCQVAIVGAGPAGLACAIRLRQLGVREVLLIDREATAGGIPRHCGHSPFGMREFHRLLTGPSYARRLVRQAIDLGVELLLNTTVVKLEAGGRLILSTLAGEQNLQAAKIVICTGNRETPRAARLVSGTRPMGITTTGALQSMVYLKRRQPFRQPLIVGSELVAFSALLTCRHARIRPVAMIDSGSRVAAFGWAAMLPRVLGVPLLLQRSLKSINGGQRVESVEIEDRSGQVKTLRCDGVIFSGCFVAEASLVKQSHLQIDRRSGGPVVDQYARCSDPDYFACGNLLHPVDTAGWCWSEGRRLAAFVHADLNGGLPPTRSLLEIESASADIRYFTPQRIAIPQSASDLQPLANDWPGLQLRFNHDSHGLLRLCSEGRTITSRTVNSRAHTRQLLELPLRDLFHCQALSLDLGPGARE